MRKRELERLAEPFPEADQRNPTEQFNNALQLRVPNARLLTAEILGDLDIERFGIGWWVGHVPTRRRILIGDQLFLASSAIETNLSEAMLHLLEAEDFLEREGRSPLLGIYEEGGVRSGQLRPLASAAEHLDGELARLHIIGFLRALGSALDCLGTTVIGVAALPTRLLTGGLRSARNVLTKLSTSGKGAPPQVALAAQLEALILRQGPEGWLDWVIDSRNLYVHRGRHLQPWVLRPTGSVVMVTPTRAKIGFEAVLCLPREPDRGEVDAFRDLAPLHVLTEPAQTTLRGVFESTTGLINSSCGDLLTLWRRRREDPVLLVQPEAQWPDVELPARSAFNGYAPGTAPDDSDGMVASPVFQRRMMAAGLAGKNRWADFD